MVPGTAGFLLQYHGQGLRHDATCHSSARTPDHSSTDPIPHTTTHTAAYTTAHTTAHIATHASGTIRASGPIQLRCGCRKHLGS